MTQVSRPADFYWLPAPGVPVDAGVPRERLRDADESGDSFIECAHAHKRAPRYDGCVFSKD